MALNFNELINKPVAGEIPEGKYFGKLVRIPENGKSRESGYTGTDAHPNDIDEAKAFVRFTYEIEVEGKPRIITDLKNEKGLAVMTSHVRRQFNMQEQEITLSGLMVKMIEDGVHIYISRPTVKTASGLRRVNNVDFVPPLVSPEQNGTPTDTPSVAEALTDTDGEPCPF